MIHLHVHFNCYNIEKKNVIVKVQYDSQSDNKSETLFTSDLATVSWLSEKINSIVKYKKDTRKIQL